MKMPTKLAKYLQEVINEGGRVLFFREGDANIAIIPEAVGHIEWVVYCEWYEGNDNYSICNITGDAFKQLQKILNNGGKL